MWSTGPQRVTRVVHWATKSRPALSGLLVTLQELRPGSGGCPEPLGMLSNHGGLYSPYQQMLQRYGLNRTKLTALPGAQAGLHILYVREPKS